MIKITTIMLIPDQEVFPLFLAAWMHALAIICLIKNLFEVAFCFVTSGLIDIFT